MKHLGTCSLRWSTDIVTQQCDVWIKHLESWGRPFVSMKKGTEFKLLISFFSDLISWLHVYWAWKLAHCK